MSGAANFTDQSNQSMDDVLFSTQYLDPETMGWIWSENQCIPLLNGSMQFLEPCLETIIGPRRQGLTKALIFTVLYTIILFTGVTGNISTIIVVRRNTYMHTATNFYLVSLAVSDLISLLLGLPWEMKEIWELWPWRFGVIFCIVKTFTFEMTTYASVLTITVFTVERYVAICHPLRAKSMSSLSRARKIIIGIWIFACLISIPMTAHARLYSYLRHPLIPHEISESFMCNIPESWRKGIAVPVIVQSSTFVFFVAPMMIISVMYLLIALRLRRSGVNSPHSTNSVASHISRHSTARSSSKTDSISLHKHPKISNSSGAAQAQSRRTVLRMLVAVVVAFFVCWAPYHTQRVIQLYVTPDHYEDVEWVLRILFYLSGITLYLSSTINPILYNMMSAKFRQAFKETMCRCCYDEMEMEEMRFKRDKTRTVFLQMRQQQNNRLVMAENRRLSEQSTVSPQERAAGMKRLRKQTSDSTGLALTAGAPMFAAFGIPHHNHPPPPPSPADAGGSSSSSNNNTPSPQTTPRHDGRHGATTATTTTMMAASSPQPPPPPRRIPSTIREEATNGEVEHLLGEESLDGGDSYHPEEPIDV